MIARHIYVLLDGTNCTAASGLRKDFSNVFRVGNALAKERTVQRRLQSSVDGIDRQALLSEPQIVLYFPGPGTRKVPWKKFNAITGSETNDIVREVYLALCNNINDVNIDKLYVIGFSRGAAAAKILVSLISRFGILAKKDTHQFVNIWEAFYNKRGERQAFGSGALPIRVAFVGLFDAVSGPPRWKNPISHQRRDGQ